MAKFSYGPFSEEAREVVVDAADIALGEGSSSVLPRHLEAAVGGAAGPGRPAQEKGRIPFDESTRIILKRAHAAAVSAGGTVELQQLRRVFDPPA